ncbi:fumarylacetoacetate hydrolase family protein [Sutcliffiella horikoshii]|uniref:fumarylacetoacetate hydrolase family protein n=1 Tax=Sutcliffiella horikoshii TaxID=79883 RepID=UPI001CBFB92A|nr:fumarylacetoacetate hydrolase family protein [Sutcliffiella horikoshii]UAL45577.1 fumarylacetoacetate hydrolase family protein [Sutcliffiella horikoshii]
MKYITFKNSSGEIKAGWINHDIVVDMNEASDGLLPSDLLTLINQYEKYRDIVTLHLSSDSNKGRYKIEEVTLLAPLPRPVSVRDFYAFEEHVKTARARRGLDVIPEWYEIPVFYFTNHLAIKGPGEGIDKPSTCEWLDYELEIACIIGKEGRNIKAQDAEEYIFGYCIMNDWSARDLQAKEMKVGLGPAKGKDFATSLGPVIVTPDELESFKTNKGYNLEMTASVNGSLLSKGNFEQIHYTFAQMIERASADVTLYPGEVIGSGTVGSGCILELGTEVHRWLQPGDEVELSITGLGTLKNTIR